MRDALAMVVGEPAELHELKHKPGRRRTSRAVGPAGTAIVKVYASGRAPTVAARVTALAAGPAGPGGGAAEEAVTVPASPRVPEVLHVDEDAHLVVLSDVPGEPLRRAVLDDDLATCGRAGEAIGRWHAAWTGRAPDALTPHRASKELDILLRRAEDAPAAIAATVRRLAPSLGAPWTCSTVVHRDLYEEQVLVAGDGAIGLIDLDDTALGPAELDVGNLVAHIDLLALRAGRSLDAPVAALFSGYARSGPALDRELLDRCRLLTRLRLACIHEEPALLDLDPQSASR